MSRADNAATWYGWLAAVLPATARRFRVTDPVLAEILAAAGAELVDERPDAEIGAPERLHGDADCAIVPLGPANPDAPTRLRRVVARLGAAVRIRRDVDRARRAILRRGYPQAAVFTWDLEQPVQRRGARAAGRSRRGAELLPGAAVLVAARRPPGPTALDAAARAAAGKAGETSLQPRWPIVRASGVLVSVSERLVLRVAVGPASRELARHCLAVEQATALGAPPVVSERVPRLVAQGVTGLASWSVERRLAGSEPPILDARLRAECLDFLAALHGGGPADGPAPLGDWAATVARVCDPREAQPLLALAAKLEPQLADLPRGFGHGDFWKGNLLVVDGRLRGVVDWAAAGPGRLPLLDVLNLVTAEHEPKYFGRALVEHLLPAARSGGDELTRAYCRRLGLDLDAGQLRALAIAYWLERLARELDTYGDRLRRPVWLAHNVELPVGALVRGRAADPVHAP